MELTQYNLLLLDVMMGEISGFKMANMLKKNKATASIPIIFITAKILKRYRNRVQLGSRRLYLEAIFTARSYSTR